MKRDSFLSTALSSTLLLAVFGPAGWAQRVVASGCGGNPTGFPSEFGRAVAVAGDANGDGRADLLIGAPAAIEPAGCFCDQVGAVFLPATFAPVYGDDPGDRLGAAVAGELRLDADAIPDAVGGAPGDDDAGAECGSVFAIAGAGGALYRLFGDGAGDQLGTALARIGDLDGDGYDEFVAGAPQTATGGSGYARVYSGFDGSVIRTHAGAASGARTGLGLTSLGDLDGDGVPDYAVGSPGEGAGGLVRLHSGADGSVLRTHAAPAAGDAFGFALGGGTDLDRDGVAELVVGAPRWGAAPGSVWAFSGATGSELLRLDGTAAIDWFGAAVAGAGDFDGDGHGDLVVGAPQADPFSTWPLGSSGPGWAAVYSGTSGETLARLGGGASPARTGASVAGGGDIDGDELADVIVGGVMNNDGYGESGCVVAIGRTGDQRVERGATAASYGNAVAAVDDLDQDGHAEVLIGAPGGKDPLGNATGLARVVAASGTVLRELYGAAAGDRFGRAVADAGDVDGDGVGDLLVGSAQDHYPESAEFGVPAGHAKVFSGATGALLHHFQGPGDVAFGSALAGGRDVDGDGYDDVIVGGAVVDLAEAGFLTAGHVRVHSGLTGQVLHAYDGAESWEGLGFSVALLEDQNGDGKDEFVFGVPGRLLGPPTFSQGEIEVRSGADGTLLQTLQDADGWPLSGTALARLDDVDGDGQEDLAFSAWALQSLTSVGAVSVHSGADWSLLWSDAGEVNYSGPSVGFALASAGDFDGDGRDDLAIGIPGAGHNHATSIGAVSVHSGPSGQLLASHTGYAGWDYFGYALAGIGDANGDGQVDLAVGAPTDPNNPIGGEAGWNRVHFVLSNYLRQHAHCLQAANASGTPATIGASGKSSLAHNDLTLSVGGAPPAVNGLFFLGANTTQQSFGGGYKCVGGSVRRFPVQQTTAQGTGELVVDLTGPQAQAIQPGSSWSFQFYFRDPHGPGNGTTNFSDAVRIEFLP